MKLVFLFFLFLNLLNAQQLPSKFMGVGLGFQNSAVQKVSGWYSICTQSVTRTFLCLATDYSSGTTSNRADIHLLAYQFKSCALFETSGAGAATGSLGGVGGTFDLGGLVACKIDEKLIHAKNLVAVFSGSWNKRNVVEAPDLNNAFRTFGAQTIFRFGLGKIWN